MNANKNKPIPSNERTTAKNLIARERHLADLFVLADVMKESQQLTRRFIFLCDASTNNLVNGPHRPSRAKNNPAIPKTETTP
jgi:hypothetical protein